MGLSDSISDCIIELLEDIRDERHDQHTKQWDDSEIRILYHLHHALGNNISIDDAKYMHEMARAGYDNDVCMTLPKRA